MTTTIQAPTEGVEQDSIAHLIFELAGSAYAIHVGEVREIITSISLSPVPGSPSYLAGVINLRGHILPIVDLRRRFDMGSDDTTSRECIIVLTIESDDSMIEFGIRVDVVNEVLRIHNEEIDSAPGVRNFSGKLVFSGVARTDGGVKLILDSRTLVSQLKHDIHQARILARSREANHVPQSS